MNEEPTRTRGLHFRGVVPAMSRVCSFSIEEGKVKVTKVLADALRFYCIRCARLCCRLGGPRLTRNDAVRLEKAGLRADQFSDSQGVLRKKPNGECVFLRLGQDKAQYECVIHEHKPLLCRVFPFFVEPESVNGEHVLFLLPCRGLGVSEGRLISRDFIQNTLGPVLLALICERTEFVERLVSSKAEEKSEVGY